MSWLYSIFIAGLMFSNEGMPPVQTHYNHTESNIIQLVNFDETERFEQTYPLNANGRVSVSNVNGSITVEVWDRPEVKLEAVKIADSRERLSEFSVKINSQPDYLEVETDYESYERQNNRQYSRNYKTEVQYRLTVPRTAVLDEIETVNGEINISNTTNITKASAVNGKVVAINLQGTAKLSTVNGTVEADFDRLQTESKISLNTVNGTVNLTIPSDADATIKADTVNGSISNEFGLPIRKGKYVGKDLYGRIGSGDVQIKLNSVNGGLSVKRKNDGKNLNPATNLLSSQNSYPNNSEISPPKPPKPPKPLPKPPIVDGLLIGEAIMDAADEAFRTTRTEIMKAATEAVNERAKAKIEKAKQKFLARITDANWLVGSPVIEKRSDSFTVKDIPKVTIEANNCAVVVRGWDKAEVQYAVTKIGRNRNQTPINVQANQSGADVNIKVINNVETQRVFGVDNIRLEIFVPKKSNLKITTDGEIRLEGVSGEIELNGEDGTINVRDSEGKIHLTSTDGRVRVLGFTGEIYAQSADGDVNLEGNFQKVTARTENGSIILTLPEDTGANLTANKEITSEGLNLTKEKENNWRIGKGGANFQLQTTDGKIFLRSINTMNQ